MKNSEWRYQSRRWAAVAKATAPPAVPTDRDPALDRRPESTCADLAAIVSARSYRNCSGAPSCASAIPGSAASDKVLEIPSLLRLSVYVPPESVRASGHDCFL